MIDAYEVAEETGMGSRINTIMQTCFFAISGVLPRDEAIDQIKKSIEKTYGKRGEAVVKKNFEAVDQTLAHLHEVKVPAQATSKLTRRPAVPAEAPEFVTNVLGTIIALEGDNLPVSAFPVDGTFPTGTTQWEKRNIALEIPVWEPDLCIQCGKCVFVCPHAVIRAKVYEPVLAGKSPRDLQVAEAKLEGIPRHEVHPPGCPRRLHRLRPVRGSLPGQGQDPGRAQGDQHGAAAARSASRSGSTGSSSRACPKSIAPRINLRTVKNTQLLQPLFEFSGACAGCGETPYVKLLTQLFGDRMLVANATGCSSIYGGNLPTTPGTMNHDGRGPAWSNSLFEDNAEFGLGMRLTLDKQGEYARELLPQLAGIIGDDLVDRVCSTPTRPAKLASRQQRERVALLKQRLQGSNDPQARDLYSAWPMSWCARASGSSAVTAGPTTSATAVWIMCWPVGAMSTSWCWTPRCTPIPAGSPPSPPRAPRLPSSPPTARACPRRIWA